jgi:hypothetical protein
MSHIPIAPSKITSRIEEDGSGSVQSTSMVNLQTNCEEMVGRRDKSVACIWLKSTSLATQPEIEEV